MCAYQSTLFCCGGSSHFSELKIITKWGNQYLLHFSQIHSERFNLSTKWNPLTDQPARPAGRKEREEEKRTPPASSFSFSWKVYISSSTLFLPAQHNSKLVVAMVGFFFVYFFNERCMGLPAKWDWVGFFPFSWRCVCVQSTLSLSLILPFSPSSSSGWCTAFNVRPCARLSVQSWRACHRRSVLAELLLVLKQKRQHHAENWWMNAAAAAAARSRKILHQVVSRRHRHALVYILAVVVWNGTGGVQL